MDKLSRRAYRPCIADLIKELGVNPATREVTLTNYGRKSGKAYQTRLWFAVIDGELWIGSLSRDRSWVRNVRATRRGSLDFGTGPHDVSFEPRDSAEDVERYGTAIRRKHRVMGPLLQRFAKGEPCAFRVHAAEAPATDESCRDASPRK